MGGLGKTTLAAATARNLDVRRSFGRIAFVSAGQDPATMELQRQLYCHCTGEVMPAMPGATVDSQKELLGAAAVGKRWLVVLDDVSCCVRAEMIAGTGYCCAVLWRRSVVLLSRGCA